MSSTREPGVAATSAYLLGSDEPELARLDAQAAVYAPSTRLLLCAAGIRQGMRVLDLGTGLGHVAFELAQLVGDAGEVVGVDQSADHLAVAELRRSTSGADSVRFVEADVRSYQDGEPFDAVVARALLFHVSDPRADLRHHAAALSAGGRVLALDFDAGSWRSDPPVELVESRRDWIVEVFRRIGLVGPPGSRPIGTGEGGGRDPPSRRRGYRWGRAVDSRAAWTADWPAGTPAPPWSASRWS